MARMPQPRLHADQVDVDESLARRLLAQQMPAYAAMPLRHVQSGGTENVVFRLGEELALRMPMRPGAVGGLLKEIRWLPVVAPHLSLDIPEVVAAGQPGDGYPFPWAVVRWLPGEDALSGRIHFATPHSPSASSSGSCRASVPTCRHPGRRGSAAAARS
jgi:aminoglycoside phosphotransferase (APT) family kinase protein